MLVFVMPSVYTHSPVQMSTEILRGHAHDLEAHRTALLDLLRRVQPEELAPLAVHLHRDLHGVEATGVVAHHGSVIVVRDRAVLADEHRGRREVHDLQRAAPEVIVKREALRPHLFKIIFGHLRPDGAEDLRDPLLSGSELHGQLALREPVNRALPPDLPVARVVFALRHSRYRHALRVHQFRLKRVKRWARRSPGLPGPPCSARLAALVLALRLAELVHRHDRAGRPAAHPALLVLGRRHPEPPALLEGTLPRDRGGVLDAGDYGTRGERVGGDQSRLVLGLLAALHRHTHSLHAPVQMSTDGSAPIKILHSASVAAFFLAGRLCSCLILQSSRHGLRAESAVSSALCRSGNHRPGVRAERAPSLALVRSVNHSAGACGSRRNSSNSAKERAPHGGRSGPTTHRLSHAQAIFLTGETYTARTSRSVIGCRPKRTAIACRRVVG